MSADAIGSVSAQELRALLFEPGELALLDVREERPFADGHILLARSAPLSRLELLGPRLVPRRSTPVVLCDAGEGLAARAAGILRRHAYADVRVIAGGIAAWAAAGFELFSGVNVPSKAFGERIEHESGTPSVSAQDLDRLMGEDADLVVLDSRPFEEYTRMSIPGALNVPGAELVLRARDAAPSPATLVVVNCAGRTRSIIGAQSLIDAGLPNRVVALRNGTMGWSLAGFAPDAGKALRAPPLSAASLCFAKAAAQRVAARFAIEKIDEDTLRRFQAEAERRSLFVFDVRSEEEYRAGHVPGAVHAPGGQLVQATDAYVGVLGARIVLVDDLEVRAVMTASWLRRMGWSEVFVFAGAGNETGHAQPAVLDRDADPAPGITCAELASLMGAEGATVLDLSLSSNYLKHHIPGAWFAIRSRLAQALARIPASKSLVLTSEDGILARLAAPELRSATNLPVSHLRGGNAAWFAEGRPITSEGSRMADERLDVWLRPYERAEDVKAAMQDYLAWETDLLPRIGRDGSSPFLRTGCPEHGGPPR